MSRSWRSIIGLLLVVPLLTGCWDRREMNHLAIVVGMGIDKVGNEYALSIQAVNPAAMGKKGGSGSPVSHFEIKGRSVLQCIRRLSTIMPRYMYLSHLQIMVISEALAREGVLDVLDYLSRDQRIRPDFYLIVARNAKASDVLEQTSQLESIPANGLYNSLELSEDVWAPSRGIFLDEFIGDLVDPGRDPIISGLEIMNQKKGSGKSPEQQQTQPHMKYTGIGVFRQHRLVGFLNEEESRGYSYITDNVRLTTGTIPCGEQETGTVTLKISSSKTKLKVIQKSHEPAIQIKTRIKATVGEVNCSLDLSKKKTIEDLEKGLEKRVEDIMNAALVKLQKDYKSDVLGFGDKIHESEPQLWKKLKNDWRKHFTKIPVEYDIQVKVQNTGVENQSFVWRNEQEGMR